jgi:alpha-beta hydrolase superfamily lysophospholipase
MLARGYAANYGNDIKALVLCGLVSQMKGCEVMLNDKAFESEIVNGNGAKRGGGWMAKVFLGMTERFPNAGSPNDWIASDSNIVADHAADPFNCFNPTIQLLYDFVKLSGYIDTKDWAAKVPSKIPVYLFAGDKDPCGNYGEGLYHVANDLANTGHEITVKAYSGWRHEIHNERAIRDEVEQGIIDFINKSLS